MLVLFLIVFFWQVPHFLAIAWIYRDDYARAGLRMLPVVDREGGMTGRQMVSYCLALIPVSLAPAALGTGGPGLLDRRRCAGCWLSWPVPSASTQVNSLQPGPARAACVVDLFAGSCWHAAFGHCP